MNNIKYELNETIKLNAYMYYIIIWFGWYILSTKFKQKKEKKKKNQNLWT